MHPFAGRRQYVAGMMQTGARPGDAHLHCPTARSCLIGNPNFQQSIRFVVDPDRFINGGIDTNRDARPSFLENAIIEVYQRELNWNVWWGVETRAFWQLREAGSIRRIG